MRDQGRLVEWFDDKGYGFIQPNDKHKDRVFLHIKDFASKGLGLCSNTWAAFRGYPENMVDYRSSPYFS